MLFSVTNEIVFPVKIPYKAILCKKDSGPNFGNHDFSLLKEPMNRDKAGSSMTGCRQY